MKLGFSSARLSFDAKAEKWSRPFPILDSNHTLITVFGSPALHEVQTALSALRQAYPRSVLIGCSTSGEIHDTEIKDHSLSVGIARFAMTKLKAIEVPIRSADESFTAGVEVAKGLNQQELRAIFVLSDGLNVNGSELIRGMNSVVGPEVVITGGLAGDGPRFEKTWVITDREIGPNRVAAVGFYGRSFQVFHASRGGWDHFGVERTVTRSKDNVLYELDGESALALYEKYLGDKAQELPASGLLFPLAIKTKDSDQVLVRTLLGIDRETGAMTFAGDIPAGSSVQLMKAHFDRLIDGAEEAALSAIDAAGELQDGLAIAISCVGRRLVLGSRTEDELDVVASTIKPTQAPMVGFYSYGELSPVEGGACALHNQTMTLTIFSERALDAAILRTKLASKLVNPSKVPTREISVNKSPKPVLPILDQGNRMETATAIYNLKTKSWSEPLPELDSEQTLVLAFGSPETLEDPSALHELTQKYPRAHVIGCSSAGEIVGTQILDKSISTTISRFAYTELKSATAQVINAQGSFEAGQDLAKQLNRTDLQAIFVLSSGLGINGTALVRGINSIVDDHIVITGGLAGDGPRFEKTWIFAQGQVHHSAVTAVAFYGPHVVIKHGSQGGWDSFGPVRTVTRAEGNVVYELDGTPALALYQTYLGDKAKELPSSGLLFPLSLLDVDDESRNVVRTLLAIDQEAQSLTFAGDMPQGARVQLMKANFDRLIDGAEEAAAMACFEEMPSNALAIAISCVGRRLVLGSRTEDELEAVLEQLPKQTTLTGFYSYGELSPVAQGQCDLHNQTMTLTVISERGVREWSTAVDFDKTIAHQREEFATAASIYELDKERWTTALPAHLDSPTTLVVAFGAPELTANASCFDDLKASFPLAQIIGCSSSGEIAHTSVLDRSLSVGIVRFQDTPLKSSSVAVASADDSFRAGKTLAQELNTPALRAIFVLSDGLNVNGSELIRGMNSVVGPEVVITGGLAGDGPRFEKTWIFAHGQVRKNAVVGVGLYGDHLRIKHGSQGGWDSFGPVRTVTRAEGNVVYELDGTPALALYQTYLGDKAKELPSSGLLFPLSLLDVDDESRNVVRTLLAIDQEAQSLTFAGDMPQGARVQLMKANFDRLIDGAEEAAAMACFEEMPSNALAIAISCVGRRLVLGSRTEDELEAVLEQLPKQTTLTGFYSYGELSPVAQGQCDLHNQTMTLTVFAESLEPRKRAAPQPMIKPALPQQAPETTEQPKPTFKPSITEAPRPSDTAPAAERQRTVLAIRTNETRATTLRMEREQAHGVTTVRFSGKLDEKFNGASFGRTLEGIVILDLAEVHRVTSFGVREWLSMIKETTQVDELYLARCSEPISSQLSTIRAFSGDAHIVSFFAPYLCEHCGASLNALIDVELDAADISGVRPPKIKCARCHQHTQALDEDPVTFFSFAQGAGAIPGFVRQIIDQLPVIKSVEPVEKLVDHHKTIIRVNTTLDETIRWSRLLDGVEGDVSIDLSGAAGTSPLGIKNLVTSMTKHMHEANFSVHQTPYELLVELKGAQVEASFDEIEVEAKCSDGKTVRAKLSIKTNREAIMASIPPSATCQDCDGALDLTQSMSLIHYAAKFQPPSVQEQAPVEVAAQVSQPEEATKAQETGSRTIDLRAAIVIGLIVMLGVVVVMRMQNKAAEETPAPTPSMVVTQPTSPLPPSTSLKDEPKELARPTQPEVKEWDTPDGVLPAWADRQLTIKQEVVLLVGEATAPTRDAALEAARVVATHVLIKHIERELRGEPIATLINPQRDKVEPERVVATFKRQMGASFVLHRKEQAFKQELDGFRALVLLETSSAQVSEAIKRYSDSVELTTASFGVRFPSISAQDDFDVIVLKSSASKLQPGDIVLSEAQEPIYDLEALKARIKKRAFLRLVVSSSSVAKAVNLPVREAKSP